MTEHRRPSYYAVPLTRGPILHLGRLPGQPDPGESDEVRRWVRQGEQPTAVDLFCGAGGLSLGLMQAGFRILVGADSDPVAVETHTANLGGLGYTGDLTDVPAFLRQLRQWGINHVDVVAGGVPCQPFSRAGRSKIRSLVTRAGRPARDARVDLWRSVIGVVAALRPRAVLLENVPDLAAWNGGSLLTAICANLEKLGYRTDALILDAFEFGVPQHRSRLFIAGVRRSLDFAWPQPSVTRNTVRDAIGDLPEVPGGHRVEALPYAGPLSELQRQLRYGMDAEHAGLVFDHITRSVRPDDAEAFALLREGGTYADLPPRLQRYRADIFTDKYKRLEWDGLSRSITAHLAKDGYWYIHPNQDRTLSVREAARIQTFPDWFRFAGTPSARYRQIGNAVPPLLARAIGVSLEETLGRPAKKGRPPGPSRSFRLDLLRWYQGAKPPGASAPRRLPRPGLAALRVGQRLLARTFARPWQVTLDLQRLAGSEGYDERVDTAVRYLAAKICRPTQPACAECPVRRHCVTYARVRTSDALESVA